MLRTSERMTADRPVLGCPFPDKLPYTVLVLIESAMRNCDGFQITKDDVEKIMDWEKTSDEQVEIPFKPGRVILQVYIHVLNIIFDSHIEIYSMCRVL